jgi:protocatechuate 3,4-dioxygenase beta subunit
VTGEPLKKTHVILQGTTADNMGTGASMMTGPDGTFLLKDVEPGTYRLNANRTGFAPTSYGARRLSSGGADLKLAAGQAMQDIVLRLQPQAVITGRITDTDGEPVANVSVSLVRSYYRNGQRTMASANGATTNDLGEYRIFGVQAGRYKLRAIPRENTFGSSGEQEEFAPTYYPGQPDAAGAASIDLQPGQNLRGVDMVVLRTATRRVRGTVVAPSVHADVIQVMATLRDPGISFMERRTAMIRPGKPKFEFRLAPGAYNLTAYFNDGAEMVTGVAQVDVGDSDIDNISIQLQPGADIAGRLRIEGANDLSALAQSNVQVRLFPKDMTFIFGSQASGRVGDDGAFTLKNAGPQPMNVSVSGLPAGYYVKAINYGQQDAKANGLTYVGSSDAVEIVVSPNGATVQGLVHTHGGDPVSGATVVLAPPLEERSNSQRFRMARTDQNGHFSLKGIEPDDYTVYAWEDIEPGQYMDPDVLKGAENHGKSLKLKEGAQESLDLESIPAEETPAAAGF